MFPNELDVRVIPGGKYLLLSPFVYAHENGGQIRVPKGFKTDMPLKELLKLFEDASVR